MHNAGNTEEAAQPAYEHAVVPAFDLADLPWQLHPDRLRCRLRWQRRETRRLACPFGGLRCAVALPSLSSGRSHIVLPAGS